MKKNNHPHRNAGIWIDQEDAYVIQVAEGEEPVIRRFRSGVESRVRYQGESKAFTRFGQSFLSDQEKKQRRQKNQKDKFFRDLIGEIRQDDYLFLFGPGKTKEGLNNAIEKEPDFKGKVVQIVPADRMTQNQLVAKTIEFFNGEKFLAFKKGMV